MPRQSIPERAEFAVLIRSFLEYLVDAVGKDRLESVVVIGDDVEESAEVRICLTDKSFDSELRAIEHLADVRDVFMDELSFGYSFVDSNETVVASPSRAHEFVVSC